MNFARNVFQHQKQKQKKFRALKKKGRVAKLHCHRNEHPKAEKTGAKVRLHRRSKLHCHSHARRAKGVHIPANLRGGREKVASAMPDGLSVQAPASLTTERQVGEFAEFPKSRESGTAPSRPTNERRPAPQGQPIMEPRFFFFFFFLFSNAPSVAFALVRGQMPETAMAIAFFGRFSDLILFDSCVR